MNPEMTELGCRLVVVSGTALFILFGAELIGFGVHMFRYWRRRP